MRIRQVKPEFWSDPDMAELPAPVRLTYIGLWNLSDDAGWFVADATYIAHQLYGYDDRATREDTVAEHIHALQAAGKVVLEDCGHALIPTLAVHQRQSAATRRVEMVKKAHEQCIAAAFRSKQQQSAESRSVSVKVKVEEGNVEERIGRDDREETTSEFRAKYAAVAARP